MLLAAPAALAHAQLLGTSPASGATVPTQPAEVIFKFNQSVGGTLGAVRVYDAQGQEVDNLDVSHPQGQEHWMGVGLKAHLPDGTYTATYRVISADTHIVYGGIGVQHRPSGSGAALHGGRADQPQQDRRGHDDRLRRRALPGLRLDRAVARRACVPGLRVASGSRRRRRRRAALAGGLARVRAAVCSRCCSPRSCSASS